MSDHPMTIAVGEDAESALAIACFDRAPPAPGAEEAAVLPCVRRCGGGVPAFVGPGILRVVFRFPMDGRVSPDAARILNRAVRPLLTALRSLTPLAHYFGRDVVSIKIGGVRHDVAALGFAHDGEAETGIFEAFLGVRQAARRDLGRLADLLKEAPLAEVAERVTQAFVREGAAAVPLAPLSPALPEPAWDVTTETPFARVGASRAPLDVGGDFFASSDWMRHLKARLRDLSPSPTPEQLAPLFAEVAPGCVLVGVESPRVLHDTVRRALSAHPQGRE